MLATRLVAMAQPQAACTPARRSHRRPFWACPAAQQRRRCVAAVRAAAGAAAQDVDVVVVGAGVAGKRRWRARVCIYNL